MSKMSSEAQRTQSEEDSSGSDLGSEVSLEPETDRFGFILTNGSTAERVGPSVKLVRQREAKWINMIGQWDRILLKKSHKVKLRCQKGIPDSLRAKCWPLLCGATDRMRQNKNLYESLDSQPGLQSWVDIIERDLDRQFPFHEMFLSKDGHGQRGLFRVLKAYTQFQPEEGYCQAQGPVAAVLLMNMPAEEAFWCLVQISEQFLPGYYSPLLEGVLFDATILAWVLKKTCPAAHKHLQQHSVEPLMFATDWLMCLFTRHLPFNTLVRVWDLFFCYGVRVLLQVAVVLVRRVLGRAEQRKECVGQMETLERLRGVKAQVQDEEDVFIDEVCSVPLSSKDLEKRTEKELEKWRKDKPSSTFDPRGRCHGFRMAWARARQREEERERNEREKGNLSVPLERSASTLSLSPSLLHKKWKKGGKVNAGDLERGNKIVRHLSMGAKDDWRNWTDLEFKKVQGVQEEEDVQEGHRSKTEFKEKESEEHLKEPKVENIIITEHKEETITIKQTNKQEESKSTEEDNQPGSRTTLDQKEERPDNDQTAETVSQPTEVSSPTIQETLRDENQLQTPEEQNSQSNDQDSEVMDTNETETRQNHQTSVETETETRENHQTSVETETRENHQTSVETETETRQNHQTSVETETRENHQTSVETVTRENHQTSVETVTRENHQTSVETETRENQQTSVETETRKNDQTSVETETRENHETSVETETREDDQTSVETETRKNDQTSVETETRENHETSVETETREDDQTSVETETRENHQPSMETETETRENDQTSVETETRENHQTSVETETRKNDQTSVETETSENHQTSVETETRENHETSVETETREKRENHQTSVETETRENHQPSMETETETRENDQTSVETETRENHETSVETETREKRENHQTSVEIETSENHQTSVETETREKRENHQTSVETETRENHQTSVEIETSENHQTSVETETETRENDQTSVEAETEIEIETKENHQTSVEDIQTEIQAEDTTNAEAELQGRKDSGEETIKQADVNPEEETENTPEDQVDTSAQAPDTGNETDPDQDQDPKTDPQQEQEKVITETKEETFDEKHLSDESSVEKTEEAHAQMETETQGQVKNAAVQDRVDVETTQADTRTETQTPTLPENIQQRQETEIKGAQSDAEELVTNTPGETGTCAPTNSEETQTAAQTSEGTSDCVAPAGTGDTLMQSPEQSGESSTLVITSETRASERPASPVAAGAGEEGENTEKVQETPAGKVFTPTAPTVTDSNRLLQDRDCQAGKDRSQAAGRRSSCSSGDVCIRKSSSSKLTRRLSEDLFTSPEKTNALKEVKTIETTPDEMPTETPQPDTSKRFGLFRKLKGETPRKDKQKKPKLQVPKILIQDFSDVTEAERPAEDSSEEKLSSRERRRRRREQERKEKEEERLKRKKEKQRRKPQSRGKGFQEQEGKKDAAPPAKTGSQTLSFSASYAESYF